MSASSIAKILGRRGGLARRRNLPAEARKQIASLGGQARRRSREAAERIMTNLRYAATVEALRGGRPRVKSGYPSGPLPDIHPRPPERP